MKIERDENLQAFATERQAECLRAYWDADCSAMKAAEKLGVNNSLIYQAMKAVRQRAARVIRRITSMLLAKHERVHLLMAEGNHDLASSAWLRELFAALYADEPRITVETRPDPYYCIEHGLTSLFVHHGHKKPLPQIESVFVAKFRDVFGRTKHSYAHMGHLHHDVVRESNLMKVEQHRTLAAPDSHASRGGWLSGRDAKVITYSSTFGEVCRSIVSFDMLQGAA